MPLKETNNLHPQCWGRAGENIKPQEKHTSSIKPLVLELQVLLVHLPILSSLAKVDLMIHNNALCQHVKVNHIPVTETGKRKPGSGKSWALQVQSRLMPQKSCNPTKGPAQPAGKSQVTSYQVTSLKLCFSTQATAWFLWHSHSHAVC